jgi:hypothetical protein
MVEDCAKRKLVGDILQPFIARPDGHLRRVPNKKAARLGRAVGCVLNALAFVLSR